MTAEQPDPNQTQLVEPEGSDQEDLSEAPTRRQPEEGEVVTDDETTPEQGGSRGWPFPRLPRRRP